MATPPSVLQKRTLTDLFFANRRAHAYGSDVVPFMILSGLLVLVDGLLGDAPVRPVGVPEKIELLDEAVKCL